MSQIWAADAFTRLALAFGASLIGAMAWKLPVNWLVYVTQILAIALCIDALTDFSYFFVGGGEINGQVMSSDTAKIGSILGGPYWLWGGVVTLLTILILVFGVYFSDKWARDHEQD